MTALPSGPGGSKRRGHLSRPPAAEPRPLSKGELRDLAGDLDRIESVLDDPGTEWVDVDAAGRELAIRDLAAARKARGLTQAQLGELVGMPQSQISRIERNPDLCTVRTIRKIAKVLKVDVSWVH